VFLALLLSAFVVGFFLDALVTVAFGTSLHSGTTTKLTWGIAIGQLASYIPIVTVIVTLLPWVAERTLAEFGLRPLTRRDLGMALTGTVAMYAVTVLAAGIQYLITHQQPHEEAVALFTSTSDVGVLVVFALIATVAAPFVEEMVFRGFLFNALLKYMPVWSAAVLSGLIFGISHFSLSAFVPLGCSGIVLAYVYYLSGSLTAAMLTHALFNAVNLAALATGHT
jgi:membrane protease YdiL (CAAX protease family)